MRSQPQWPLSKWLTLRVVSESFAAELTALTLSHRAIGSMGGSALLVLRTLFILELGALHRAHN